MMSRLVPHFWTDARMLASTPTIHDVLRTVTVYRPMGLSKRVSAFEDGPRDRYQVKSSQVVGLRTRVASIWTLIFFSPHPYPGGLIGDKGRPLGC